MAPKLAIVSRERPRTLRALGKSEPPLLVTVDGESFERDEVFKHDSWAATAAYKSKTGRHIVCKFNRRAAIALLPMGWLGRILASREKYFLDNLSGVRGIPKVYPTVAVNGQVWKNAVAHDYIPGKPLSITDRLRPDFFEKVEELLGILHARRIVYVDLHKQENVLVGDDGLPYLIDFQVSVQLPDSVWCRPLFRALRDCDCYHLDKHRWIHRMPPASGKSWPRPFWLQLHRQIGVPLRTLRRRLLVLLGVPVAKAAQLLKWLRRLACAARMPPD